jgi:glutathione S-transferase
MSSFSPSVVHSMVRQLLQAIMAMPAMQEWLAAAEAEPDEVVELDVEF